MLYKQSTFFSFAQYESGVESRGRPENEKKTNYKKYMDSIFYSAFDIYHVIII